MSSIPNHHDDFVASTSAQPLPEEGYHFPLAGAMPTTTAICFNTMGADGAMRTVFTFHGDGRAEIGPGLLPSEAAAEVLKLIIGAYGDELLKGSGVRGAVLAMNGLSENDFAAALDELRKVRCLACGGANPRCQCSNDE